MLHEVKNAITVSEGTKKGYDNGLRIVQSQRGGFYIDEPSPGMPIVKPGDKIKQLNGRYSEEYSSVDEIMESIKEVRRIDLTVLQMKIESGDYMRLRNLRKKKEFNGCLVKVIEQDRFSSDRWMVKFNDDHHDHHRQLISIHSSNLVPHFIREQRQQQQPRQQRRHSLQREEETEDIQHQFSCLQSCIQDCLSLDFS